MQISENSFEPPKGRLSCSEKASEVPLLRAETNPNALLTLGRLLSKTQIISDTTSKIRI